MSARSRDTIGNFYAIQLDPSSNPEIIKLGWALDTDKRLHQHRKERNAPAARLLKSWPCRFAVEKEAIRAVSAWCRRIHGETFAVTDVPALLDAIGEYLSEHDELPAQGKILPFLLRIPRDLLDEIRVIAKQENRTVSGQIVYFLRRAVPEGRTNTP